MPRCTDMDTRPLSQKSQSADRVLGDPSCPWVFSNSPVLNHGGSAESLPVMSRNGYVAGLDHGTGHFPTGLPLSSPWWTQRRWW